jgi:hypothetical protein
LLLGAAAAAHGQVFSSDFFSDPVSEGWNLVLQYCDPQTWNDQGWYHQALDRDACPAGSGGREVYRRSLQPFNGTTSFFAELRLQTDGDRSEIPYGAPTVLVLGNSFGVIYHMTVAEDLVKFIGHFDLPGRFIGIEPGVPHTYRIDLYRIATPSTSTAT